MNDDDSKVLVIHIKDSEQKEPPSPAILNPILNAMEILAGGIRAHLGNQDLKKNLLDEVKNSRELLQSGRTNQAFLKLTIIGDEVQRVRQKPVDIIHKDLIKTKRQLFDLV